MEIKIETTVPLPENAQRKRNKFPFIQMNPGESFEVLGDQIERVRQGISRFSQRNPGYIFTTRKTGKTYRIWCVAKP